MDSLGHLGMCVLLWRHFFIYIMKQLYYNRFFLTVGSWDPEVNLGWISYHRWWFPKIFKTLAYVISKGLPRSAVLRWGKWTLQVVKKKKKIFHLFQMFHFRVFLNGVRKDLILSYKWNLLQLFLNHPSQKYCIACTILEINKLTKLTLQQINCNGKEEMEEEPTD